MWEDRGPGVKAAGQRECVPSEQYADREVDKKALKDAWKATWAACRHAHQAGEEAVGNALWVAAWAADWRPYEAASRTALGAREHLGPQSGPLVRQVLRDVFDNPFRAGGLDPSWVTPSVAALAGAIYAGRAWDRLPVLADALEDAGGDAPEVLAHCRGPGPHARGCWVVDLVLGKG